MKQRHFLAALAALGLTLSACGGSSSGGTATTAAEKTTTTAGSATTKADSTATTMDDTATTMDDTATTMDDTATTAGSATTTGGDAMSGDNCKLGKAEPMEGELIPVRVVVLPIADVAPVYYGVECGQWAAAGLDVQIQVADSGGAAGQAVVNGEADLGVSAWASMTQPWLNGAPLMVAVDGAVLPPTGVGLLVAGDSEIAAPADLAGKSIAINARGGSPEVALRLWATKNNVDFDSLNLVETPPAEMVAAVQAGSVDAILALEPFSTVGQKQGLKALDAEMYAGIMQDGSTGGLMATKPWVEGNAETLAKIREAWAGIVELFQGDDAGLREYLATYTGIPADITAAMTIANFRTTTEVANIQPAIDAVAESGMIAETFDVTPFVAP